MSATVSSTKRNKSSSKDASSKQEPLEEKNTAGKKKNVKGRNTEQQASTDLVVTSDMFTVKSTTATEPDNSSTTATKSKKSSKSNKAETKTETKSAEQPKPAEDDKSKPAEDEQSKTAKKPKATKPKADKPVVAEDAETVAKTVEDKLLTLKEKSVDNSLTTCYTKLVQHADKRLNSDVFAVKTELKNLEEKFPQETRDGILNRLSATSKELVKAFMQKHADDQRRSYDRTTLQSLKETNASKYAEYETKLATSGKGSKKDVILSVFPSFYKNFNEAENFFPTKKHNSNPFPKKDESKTATPQQPKPQTAYTAYYDLLKNPYRFSKDFKLYLCSYINLVMTEAVMNTMKECVVSNHKSLTMDGFTISDNSLLASLPAYKSHMTKSATPVKAVYNAYLSKLIMRSKLALVANLSNVKDCNAKAIAPLAVLNLKNTPAFIQFLSETMEAFVDRLCDTFTEVCHKPCLLTEKTVEQVVYTYTTLSGHSSFKSLYTSSTNQLRQSRSAPKPSAPAGDKTSKSSKEKTPKDKSSGSTKDKPKEKVAKDKSKEKTPKDKTPNTSVKA